MVFVAAEKIVGLFFHLIGSTNGKARSFGSPGLDKKATPSLGMSLMLRLTFYLLGRLRCFF